MESIRLSIILFQACVDFVPVDDAPQGTDVPRAGVAVIDIIGVLPHVEGEQRLEALGDGVAGVAFLGDDEFAVRVEAEPDPAGAEEAGALGGEFLLEGFEAAELRVDQLRNLADGGVAFARRAELQKIKIMIEDLPGIVEDAAFGRADDLLEGLAFERGAGDGRVQVVHICLEMLSVVECYGLCADCRCKRVGCVRKGDEFEHSIIV